MFRSPHPKHLIVKSGLQGQGVFTLRPIKADDVIFEMKGKMVDAPTQTSVQVGDKQHIEDNLAKYLNHHCEASARVDREKKALVALRNLNPGDEITFDYRKNEDKMAVPFMCGCCGKRICGKSGKPAENKNPAILLR
ncbi:MAG TPA: SET domain-containing protein-lysine N-methyltransferase [Gammaproteobacteria bacterium]|nr:SET domain-containing protein-lysine N-methyltransferase [Gammaproteobacteria bacterium]